MDDSDRIDLSALDPCANPERWRAVVDATLQRVDVALAARPRDPLTLIASWSRTLLASSALIVLVLIPVELALESREARAEQVQTLVRLSTETALGEAMPTGAELSAAISGAALP